MKNNEIKKKKIILKNGKIIKQKDLKYATNEYIYIYIYIYGFQQFEVIRYFGDNIN